MFGIGETELVIIVVFAFLLFGPDKLPGMGRTLGRMLRQFREASDGLTEVVQTSIMDPAAEELERSDKSPKQRRREAELEAQAQAQAQALDASAEAGEAEGGETAEAAPEPPRRETFAERKARLMAERQAKERAEAEAAAAQAAQTDQAEADAAEPVAAEAEATTSTSAAPEVAGPAAPAQEEPAPTTRTAADLYAMGGQRSSRFRAAETEVTETVAAADAAEEGEAPAGAPEDESDAKEEGGER